MTKQGEQEVRLAQAAEHLRKAFSIMGVVSPDDPETDRTPTRVAHLKNDLFWGLDPARKPKLSLTETDYRGLVLLKDLPFYSMCAHHLLPFFGTAAIGYLPSGKVAGLGSFPKLLSYYAARPQLQERLAEQLVEHLDAELKPQGLIVHLSARQMCVEMRGASSPCQVDVTAARGRLYEDESARHEFFRRLAAL